MRKRYVDMYSGRLYALVITGVTLIPRNLSLNGTEKPDGALSTT
jgi:hypothetical protein